MKEVTICFSFSLKDGLTKSLLKDLTTLHGLSIDGAQTIKMHRLALNTALSLLQHLNTAGYDVSIRSVALRERKAANRLDDLKAKNSTHAKGE